MEHNTKLCLQAWKSVGDCTGRKQYWGRQWLQPTAYNKVAAKVDLLEGCVARVALPCHVFILAPILGDKVCQLVCCFPHLWVHGLLHSCCPGSN